jgi:hypothetical protein
MHIRNDAPSGNATGTLLPLRSAPAVVQVSARCWEAGAAQVSALLLDWVVRHCIRISCAIDIVATRQRCLPCVRQV